MRPIIVALSAIHLAGCDSRSGEAGNVNADASSAALEEQLPHVSNLAAPEQASPGLERARAALGSLLRDADSARYLNLRSGAGGAICGEVDPIRPDGSHAGSRPFIVAPNGTAAISRSPRLALDDPEDPFPELYIRWCASPGELRALQQQIAAAAPPRAEIVVEEAEELSRPATPDESALPSRWSSPGRASGEARGGINRRPKTDSFSDAILRPDDTRR
jgi:hypothetical protein